MDFALSSRALELREQLAGFIQTRVEPAEAVYREQVEASGDPHFHPPVMEELKEQARRRGLWNLLSCRRPLGRRPHQPRLRAALRAHGREHPLGRGDNSRRPTPATWRSWPSSARPSSRTSGCVPLLEGEIRSGFAMTEPWVASSDARNIASTIEPRRRRLRHQRPQVVDDGRGHPNCRFVILMGVSDPTPTPTASIDDHRAARHPGRPLVRTLPVFGHDGGGGHGELAVRRRARARDQHPRGGGRRLRARPGPPRPRPHPPLHARHRAGREGARADVPRAPRAGSRSACTSPIRAWCRTASPSRASRSSRPACSR